MTRKRKRLGVTWAYKPERYAKSDRGKSKSFPSKAAAHSALPCHDERHIGNLKVIGREMVTTRCVDIGVDCNPATGHLYVSANCENDGQARRFESIVRNKLVLYATLDKRIPGGLRIKGESP